MTATTLTLARTQALRRTPGATALLYLTDRCPVGCDHCSVAARPDGPAPRDPVLLDALLTGLCDLPALRVVAVSGGEPFTERAALATAVRRLRGAGKRVVVFTSGHWARATTPEWVRDVLAGVDTVFLGVDAQHTARLGAARLRRAVTAVVAAGCHLVLQTIDTPANLDLAHAALTDSLGDDWPDRAEIHRTGMLATGRAAALFPPPPPPPPRPATAFGPCLPARAPTVRHDGTVLGCCNEAVITGDGPAALRRTARTAPELGRALREFGDDPLLRVVAAHGPGALSGVPGFETLASGRYATVCEACWAAHAVTARDPRAAAVLRLLAPPAPAPAPVPVAPTVSAPGGEAA